MTKGDDEDALANTAAVDTLAASTVESSNEGDVGGLDTPRDDRYQLGAEVGRGGLGRVMRARDRVLERPVAVKELFSADAGAQRRFVREAMITARLQHPAIVPIYDAGRRDNRSPYYAMKLVSGRPLERAIAEATTLDARLALVPMVLAVADAVAYAHGQRIIHRDLKPANVLLGEFGETIVIDWGLAKDLATDDRDAVELGPYRDRPHDETVVGALMGTPAYMAPEQALGEVVDERADVYALGAILYHVIAGLGPHEGTTLDQMLDGVVAGRVKPLVEREPDVPRDLAAIVAKAMATAADDRYGTAAPLADDLRKFLAGKLVGAHRYTVGQRLRRWFARHRAVASVTAIAVVALIAIALFSLRRITHERDAAIAQANRAIVTQARAIHDTDPAGALEVLQQLDVRGPGWDEARVIATGALAMPRLEGALDGMTDSAFRVTRDEAYAVTFGPRGLWIANLAAKTTRTVLRHPKTAKPELELTMCDDDRHALADTTDDTYRDMIEVDLAAATTKPVANPDEAKRACHPVVPDAWPTPDGQFVITRDALGGLHRSDRAGHELAQLPAIASEYRDSDLAMSDNGEVVAEINGGDAIYSDFTWNLRFLAHKSGRVSSGGSIAVAPDGSHVWGVAYGDGGSKWSMERRFRPRTDDLVPGSQLAVSHDGKWLIGMDDNRVLKIVELAGNASVSIHEVTWAHTLSGDRVAVTGNDGQLRIYHLTPRARRHEGRVWYVAVSRSGQELAVAHPKSLERSDASTGTHSETATVEADSAPQEIAIDDARDVAAIYGAHVIVWPHGSAVVKELGLHERARRVALLQDGTPVTTSDTELKIWSTPPRTIAIARYDDRLIVDDAGTRALTACDAGRCTLDLATGRVEPLVGAIMDVAAISGDGHHALTANATGVYQLWDLDTRTSRPINQSVGVELAALSRDGSIAVIGTSDRAMVLDLVHDTAISLRGHRIDGNIDFSPDQRTMLANDFIDVRTGEIRESPDGGFLASAIRDDGAIFVSLAGVIVTSDDLPRNPRELLDMLRARTTVGTSTPTATTR